MRKLHIDKNTTAPSLVGQDKLGDTATFSNESADIQLLSELEVPHGLAESYISGKKLSK